MISRIILLLAFSLLLPMSAWSDPQESPASWWLHNNQTRQYLEEILHRSKSYADREANQIPAAKDGFFQQALNAWIPGAIFQGEGNGILPTGDGGEALFAGYTTIYVINHRVGNVLRQCFFSDVPLPFNYREIVGEQKTTSYITPGGHIFDPMGEAPHGVGPNHGGYGKDGHSNFRKIWKRLWEGSGNDSHLDAMAKFAQVLFYAILLGLVIILIAAFFAHEWPFRRKQRGWIHHK